MNINDYRAIRDRNPIKWTQADMHLRFKHLRNGTIRLASTAAEIAALLDESKPQPWRTRPAQGALPRVAPGTGLAGATRAEFNAANLRLRPSFFDVGTRVRLSEGQRTLATTWVNLIARQLSRLGFRFDRTLGWGGEGIACLFSYTNRNGLMRQRVAKIGFAGNGWRNERERTMQFRGQDHILQRHTAADLGLAPELRAPAIAALDDERLMLFEFAKYGSLGSLLKKASPPISRESGQFRPLPDRVLIHIFHCLVEGCLAMEAPCNRDVPPNPSPIVHFDLEPSNTLFANRRLAGRHSILPILKIADFGLAKAIPSIDIMLQEQNRAKTEQFLWNLRWRAKPFQFLPEQFSQDWDYIDRNPLVDNVDTYGPVAGHFGPASNIYHIGLIMWCCITGLQPKFPTTPVQAPMELADGDPWWTWAGDELLDDDTFGEVDKEIRELVMRCLIEEPARRIDGEILLAYCQDKLEELSLVDGSRDDDLDRWVNTYFNEPPAITFRPPFDPANISNDQIVPFQWT